MMKRTIWLLVASVLIGCDPFGERVDERTTTARREYEQRNVREERDRFARSMTDYANGKLRLVEARQANLTREVQAARADFDRLSEIVRKGQSEKDADGKELKIEQRLLNLLRNPEVNVLAKKYLATDFSVSQGEFIERVRIAREDEANYGRARAESEASYAATVRETQKWSKATAEQRDAEIARVKAEISALERKRAEVHRKFQESTRKTLVGNVAHERERLEKRDVLERKVSDLDEEINTKRRQIDFLRNPTASRSMVSRTTDRAMTVERQAANLREQKLRDIERHYKPKETVVEIVSEWSAKTVGRLQDSLSAKILSAEGDLASLSQQSATIREALLAIPVSDLGELKRIKAKIEGSTSDKAKK